MWQNAESSDTSKRLSVVMVGEPRSSAKPKYLFFLVFFVHHEFFFN